MIKFNNFRIFHFLKEADGFAVVEAAILFPFMILVFAALVLLSIYLPARAALQHATQYAATVLATEKSDTWLFFDENSMSYRWETDKNNLDNVYVTLVKAATLGSDDGDRAETIVRQAESKALSFKLGELYVHYEVVNRIIYKEIVIIAMRTIPIPLDLSFIDFPAEIKIAATSTAVISNGDEFIRSIDMSAYFIGYISEKLGLDSISDSIKYVGDSLSSVLGW